MPGAGAVHHIKNGTPSIHGLAGDELRLIRALIRENGESSRFLFLSERKAPLSTDGAQKLIERLGEASGFKFSIHTCSGIPRDTPWQAVASILARSKPSWATSPSATP